jgi:adenylate cyclase class 2
MYEVEVKERLRAGVDIAIRHLIANGFSFGKPLFQHDTVYAREESDITEWRPGVSVARIRTERSRSILNAKTYTKTPLTKIEHETIIEQPEEAAAILKALGLKEITRVEKWRHLGTKDGLTACVDEVVDLGTFVEFELLYREPPPISAQDELHQLAISLLPGIVTRIFAGYDELALARAHS